MRKLSTLRIIGLLSAVLSATWSQAQTTVFNDDFSTNTSASWTTSGAIGASAWNITRSGSDFGGRRNTSPAQLELTNDASGTTNVNGWAFASTSTASFSSPYTTTLSSNTGQITWTFNIRQIRADPAGFSAGSYGAAFILAGSNATAGTAGNGYAIVYGQSGASDPIRLVHYTTGLQGTLSNLITSNTTGLTDFGAEYISVKVTYAPATNTWELFLRNDGGTAFADPTTGTLVSQGTAISNTYTGTALGLMGGYWNGSTTANQTAFFDNVKVVVDPSNTSVQFASTNTTVNEGVGTVSLTLEISNEDAINDTEVDVVLVTGSAGRVNGYTTQTVTFPGGSGADQTVVITISDNGLCDGNTIIGFELQNISGGQGTVFIGTNDSYDISITDNDGALGYVIARQAFDGLGSDNWAITAGAGNVSGAIGAGDAPASQRVLSGTASWQIGNANAVLDLADLDVSGYTNIVLTARLSSTSVVPGNGAEINDLVRFYIASNGGAFPGTADITVTGASANNARWGYATGTGVATTSAGTPATFTPAGSGNRTTDGYSYISITIPGSPNSIALRVNAVNNNADERWNIDDIQITGDYCSTVYYSRADGNVGDAIWSETPSGTAGSVTFDRFKSMVVQNGDVVAINTNTRTNNFTVDAGGQVDLAANTFTVSGDVFDNNGTVTAADNSTILLNSTDLVTVESSSPLNLFNLTANTPGDVLTDATINIRGTLLLQDGGFDASLGSVTLASDVNGTGRLGPVAAGATYTGDMTVQRYIPAGKTNWRFLGSPVSGQTVNEWKDDFYTAGFPGSHSPTFSNPVGSGILWPSIRRYDETRTYAHIDTGWVGVSSNAQALTAGQGFAAWCGTGLTTTTAFTVDVTGEPHIAQSPITRNLDYTNNSAPLIDGWNAVSNPLPSPILFSSLTRTNVEDYVYIFNPAIGNVAVWDVGSSLSTNNGTDTIQSSQAFMVQAISSGASIAFEEADKVNDRQGGFFGGSQHSLFNGVRLKISSALNTFSDETLVSFGNGAEGVDGDDVPKMTFAHPDAPQIATRVANNHFAINATGSNAAALAIPVKVSVGIAGTYTVTASDMENIGLTCLVLEDLETGTITPLVEGATYSFAMETNAGTEPRLMLRASARVPLYAEGATCHGMTNGRGTVVHVGDSPMDITWTNAVGTVILQQTIEGGVAIHNELAPGTYGITVSSNAGCGALNTSFTITEPAAMEVLVQQVATSCANTADGLVDLTVLGGTAPYTFAWSDGSSEEDLAASAGTYTVVIVDDRGCTVATPEFSIVAGVGPVALAEASATTVLVNTPITFANNSTNADTHTWDFGDGQVSTVYAPEHSWAIPGTYTVTLFVDDGDCTDTWTAQVLVEASTGIASTTVANGVSAWFANDKFVVEHAFSNSLPVVVDVLDATGRLHATRQFAGTPARVNVPAEGLSTGIWFVRVSNNGNTRTVRVPLVR